MEDDYGLFWRCPGLSCLCRLSLIHHPFTASLIAATSSSAAAAGGWHVQDNKRPPRLSRVSDAPSSSLSSLSLPTTVGDHCLRTASRWVEEESRWGGLISHSVSVSSLFR